MINKLSSLDFSLINTRFPDEAQEELCEKAFKFWHSSWEETFQNLGEEKTLYSDDFLDRTVSVLSFQGQPVALFFNNFFDIYRNSIKKHSYFKNYPSHVNKFLQDKNFRNVMTLTYMTIHPEWRVKYTDFPIFDLLFSLSMLQFKESDSDALIGYIRTDKSFFTTFYNHGAQKIVSGQAYSVPVDYCFVTKSTAKVCDKPEVGNFAEKLWAPFSSAHHSTQEVA